MTRQHFVALANALQKQSRCVNAEEMENAEDFVRQTIARKQWRNDCLAVVSACKSFNSGFNTYRFLEACGWTPEELEGRRSTG